MAFSNVRRVPLGGGLSIIVADFTATVGAADQTLAVSAGRILMARFNPQTTAEPVDYSTDIFDVSTSGAITTVTIRSEAGVSAGTFVALLDNGG